jgi:hypothetical protein
MCEGDLEDLAAEKLNTASCDINETAIATVWSNGSLPDWSRYYRNESNVLSSDLVPAIESFMTVLTLQQLFKTHFGPLRGTKGPFSK